MSGDTPSDQQWSLLEEHYRTGKPVMAKIVEASKTHMIVEINGIRGIVDHPGYFVFAKNSHGQRLADRSVDEQQAQIQHTLEQKLTEMRGQQISLKIIMCDRKQQKLFLSQQIYTPEEQAQRQQRQENLLRELRPGDIRRGVVLETRSVSALIDLGYGLRARLSRNYLADHRVNTPAEILQVGQEVKVMVIGKNHNHINLSLIHAEHCADVLQQLHIGEMKRARIISLADEGVYVDLNGPLGFIPTHRAVSGYITHPADRFACGQELIVKIGKIGESNRVDVSIVEIL